MTTATIIGTRPTRLPAGQGRTRLFRLAQRGIQLCTRINTPGGRLLVHLCDGLERALIDLAAAELRAVNAEARLAEALETNRGLTRQLAAETFRDEATAKRPSLPELQEELEFRKEGPTSVFNVPTGVR